MKKVDNFNAGKWLVENKITTQSKLTEEVSDNVKQFLNNEFEIYLEGGDSFEEEPGETHVFTMEEDEEPYKDNYLFNSAINQLQNNPIILDYNKDYIGDYGEVTASANAKNIFISFIVPEELNENQKKYIKIDNSEYYVDENGNVKLSLNFPYEFNRSHKYNTPREEYIDKNNWKEKVNPSYPIMKVINNVPTADYEFIEYPSGDKELLVKTNIEDLKKYADGNYTLK